MTSVTPSFHSASSRSASSWSPEVFAYIRVLPLETLLRIPFHCNNIIAVIELNLQPSLTEVKRSFDVRGTPDRGHRIQRT